ncbi:cathepsin L-like [Drosophila sulfurigaster albostrigata]|uniref:cathepsin L-like n=1 Tax=Drosophila sulfurigaster albostrigata TaxID=89887 RepID=UPI002D21BAA9|nr:cathepsin L-like [Drosophila sulfurigaster albostrigata]
MKVPIKILILFGIVSCTVARTLINEDLSWDAYKVKFDKVYEEESENQLHRKIFEDNKKNIYDHNGRWLPDNETYKMGINQFSDMLDEEYNEAVDAENDIYNDSGDVEYESSDTLYNILNPSIPPNVNWAEKGVVSPVENQGHFDNSWAFAAAGVVESRQAISRNSTKVVLLSKQNLIDCCSATKNRLARALVRIRRMGGIATEESYPYRGKNGNCIYNAANIGAKIRIILQVLPGDETALAMNVAKGPVAAVISKEAIKNYKGGVFNSSKCGASPDFSVLIVGYGSSKKLGDFWIIKTSLGAQWGEKGYMRLARNKNNLCGITNRAFFAY